MGPLLARLSPLANLTRMAFLEPLVKGQSHSPLAILTRMAFPELLLKGHITPQLDILGLWQASLARRVAA